MCRSHQPPRVEGFVWVETALGTLVTFIHTSETPSFSLETIPEGVTHNETGSSQWRRNVSESHVTRAGVSVCCCLDKVFVKVQIPSVLPTKMASPFTPGEPRSNERRIFICYIRYIQRRYMTLSSVTRDFFSSSRYHTFSNKKKKQNHPRHPSPPKYLLFRIPDVCTRCEKPQQQFCIQIYELKEFMTSFTRLESTSVTMPHASIPKETISETYTRTNNRQFLFFSFFLFVHRYCSRIVNVTLLLLPSCII